eukprot:9023654-Pyramimonas_sp.AAC.1
MGAGPRIPGSAARAGNACCRTCCGTSCTDETELSDDVSRATARQAAHLVGAGALRELQAACPVQDAAALE